VRNSSALDLDSDVRVISAIVMSNSFIHHPP